MEIIENSMKKYNDNNKYLGIRVIIYLLTTIFSIETLYNIENITNTMYFNTILLYSAPLAIEYIFTNNCYSKKSNLSKNIGRFFSGTIVFFGLLGVMGFINLKLSDNISIIEGIYIWKYDVMFFVRILPFICVINTFLDFMFSFGEEELAYYDITDDLSKFAKELIENKKYKMLQDEKEKMEKEYRKKIFETASDNG
ncbi:hypothetical protein [uncultured Clostridium sp.]|uniref:hypothetical protein n=1 Tax=uncultured Clostridium sp. TaxID=59620 RepID=UPI00258F14EC|nr:hypothetical protein [uncultured Clostridium sp.]